jgi:hypothetical protein
MQVAPCGHFSDPELWHLERNTGVLRSAQE